jgi:polar amino acid transport system substrate-binding protein
MKKALSGILVAILATALFAAPTSLTVGWSDYPPFQISATSGLDIELAQAVFTQAGYTPSFQKLPWARQLSSVEMGTLDVVMDASKTEARAKFADWSNTYRQERNDLLTLVTNGTAVMGLKQLIGQNVKIGVQQDSYYGPDFDALSKDPAFKALLDSAPDTATSLTKLEAGRITFLVDDIVSVQYAVKTGKLATAVKVALPIYGDDVYFMISKKTLAADPTLLDKVNKAIALLAGNGTFKAIYAKYGMAK